MLKILAFSLTLGCLLIEGREVAKQEELGREKRTSWTPRITHEMQFNPIPGQKITIRGRCDSDAVRFNWNLVNGEGLGNENDIILHMDTRFAFPNADDRNIILNYRTNGVWGPEITRYNMPFEEGADFEIEILQGENSYKITVNGQDFYTFITTLSPMSSYNHLYIEGDITLNSVKTERTTSTCTTKQVHELLYSDEVLTVVPFTPTIGEVVKVEVTAKEEATLFHINLVDQPSMEGNIALRIGVRFNRSGNVGSVVMNDRENGVWGCRKGTTDFPILHKAKFEMEIRFKEGQYVIASNGDTVITFPMRSTPMSRFNNLIFEGEGIEKSISIE